MDAITVPFVVIPVTAVLFIAVTTASNEPPTVLAERSISFSSKPVTGSENVAVKLMGDAFVGSG
jgi:hypothetical protein